MVPPLSAKPQISQLAIRRKVCADVRDWTNRLLNCFMVFVFAVCIFILHPPALRCKPNPYSLFSGSNPRLRAVKDFIASA